MPHMAPALTDNATSACKQRKSRGIGGWLWPLLALMSLVACAPAWAQTCRAPTVAPLAIPDGVVGTAYSQTVSASGGAAPYVFSVSVGSLPPGLALNPASGALNGVPTTAGTFSFTVTATDAIGCPGSQAYKPAIFAPVVLAPATLPNGTGGVPYSQVVSASGGTGPYSFAVSAGTLPTGLVLTAGGALAGTPSAAGAFNFTITATDANGFTGAQRYTVAIAAPTMTVAPAVLPAATAGVPYSQTISASGGTAPYTFAVSSGVLPTGLTLASTGALTGTPTVPGATAFTLRATDANGFTASQAYSVTVLIPGGVPTAVSRQVATLMGVPVQVDLTAGATGGPFVSATLVSVTPAGSAVIAPTGSGAGAGYSLTFTPAPGFTGPATVTFTLSSAFATSAPATITINVAARPDPRVDPDVLGLQVAQTASTRRFADTQIINVRDRLDVLHDPSPSVWGFWVGGTSRHGDRKTDAGGVAQDFGTSGFSAGLDRRLNGRFAIGGGVGYDRDRTDVGVSGSRSDAHATTALAYGSFHPQLPFFLDATFGHQRLTFQLRRYVTQSQTVVESPRAGTQDFSSWSAGYDYRGKRWSWSPYARMDVAQATLDAYTEQGDGVYALHYDAQSVATRTSIVGLRSKFRKQVRWGKLETRFRLEMQHDFHDQSGDTLRYADMESGPTYVIAPAQDNRNRTILELGAVLETRQGITLNVEYRNVFGGLYDHDRSLTLSFQKDDRNH